MKSALLVIFLSVLLGVWPLQVLADDVPPFFVYLTCDVCTPINNWYGNNSLQIDSCGAPHIVYDAYHVFRRGDAWFQEVIDPAGGAYPTLAIDSADHLHVVYQDGTPQLKYATFDGCCWQREFIFRDHYGGLASLALDSRGNPHVVYTGTDDLNQVYWQGSRLQYAVRDTEGWHITTVANDATWAFAGPSLALDHNDHPHIAYRSGDQLKYAFFDGNHWSNSVIDTGTLDGSLTGDVSLALDSNGLSHIVYNTSRWEDIGPARVDFGVLYHSHQTGSGDWLTEVVNRGSIIYRPELVIDPSNRLHLVYSSFTVGDFPYQSSSVQSPQVCLVGTSRLKYSIRSEKGWSHYGLTWSFSGCNAIDFRGDVTLAPNGQAHITFWNIITFWSVGRFGLNYLVPAKQVLYFPVAAIAPP